MVIFFLIGELLFVVKQGIKAEAIFCLKWFSRIIQQVDLRYKTCLTILSFIQ